MSISIVERTPCNDILSRCSSLVPLQARVFANRMNSLPSNIEAQQLIDPKLSYLDHYSGLPNIELAAERIAKAVMHQEIIYLACDKDVDGVTSAAVLGESLVKYFSMPEDKVFLYIGHRLKEGYGLSDLLVDRMLDNPIRPKLIITADNGSSDEPRIARLKGYDIDVIVTDHHDMPIEGAPKSAYACVSPKMDECHYPDPLIAGCMVAWLTMCATRQALINNGYLNSNAEKLTGLLDYVACGTVADCVSMGRSVNNRAVVKAGLKLMNNLNRPCWRAMKKRLWGEGEFTATDIAFKVGPMINSRGRLDEATAGVDFLHSQNDEEAETLCQLLDDENTERKKIEKKMKEDAYVIAEELKATGRSSFIIFLPDGHPGVHGIVASRVVEKYGHPVICFSPVSGSDDQITGSARSIPGIHVRNAFQYCMDNTSGVVIKAGGHEAAGGITIQRDKLEEFIEAYEAAVNLQIEKDASIRLMPCVFTDGPLQDHEFNLDTIDHIQALQPFGREFEEPVFSGCFRVSEVKRIGADKTHLRFILTTDSGLSLVAIWFNSVEKDAVCDPIFDGERYTIAYRLDKNEFRGAVSIQAKVEYVS